MERSKETLYHDLTLETSKVYELTKKVIELESKVKKSDMDITRLVSCAKYYATIKPCREMTLSIVGDPIGFIDTNDFELIEYEDGLCENFHGSNARYTIKNLTTVNNEIITFKHNSN